MTDSVKRQLRDGVGEGEQVPVVSVRDSAETVGGPFVLKHLLKSVCENISRGRAQAKGVVTVALAGRHESFAEALHTTGQADRPLDWFQLLDCYSDPLGWEACLEGELDAPPSVPAIPSPHLCRDIRDLGTLLSLIIDCGRVSVKEETKERFVVVFDSISVLLRHHSLPAVMNFLNALRSHDQVSALLWLVHSDLHDPRTASAFEYFATTTVHTEQTFEMHSNDFESVNGGRVRVRQKRRNGRVREQVEFFNRGVDGLTFTAAEKMVQSIGRKASAPKVQFNLDLTEREREDRAKVVLPFEHQGNGDEVKIYDGRDNFKQSDTALPVVEISRKLSEVALKSQTQETTSVGEIHYLRDSDDERPDSDEDPDDDLDI